MTYSVMTDDNFHFMNEAERCTSGTSGTIEEAIAACRKIVDRFLEHLLKPGMTAEALYDDYRDFGEDPFVPGVPPSKFSAWDYAKERAAELTATAIASPPIAPR
jgi:hypothetical protein